MANGTIRTSDETNWKLTGIRDEQRRLGERLKYLQDEERRLTSAGLLGQPKKSTAKGRKRNLKPETRQKMREAANRRWAAQKGLPIPDPTPAPVDTVGA